MSAQNVPPTLKIPAVLVQALELANEEREERKRQEAFAKRQGTDVYTKEGVVKAGVASHGEAAAPQGPNLSRHDKIQNQYSCLKNAFKAAGGDEKAFAKPVEAANELIKNLSEEIEKLTAKGGNQEKIVAKEVKLRALMEAVENYQLVLADVDVGEAATVATQSVPDAGAEGASPQSDPHEEMLWNGVGEVAKKIGIVVKPLASGTEDLDAVIKQFKDDLRVKVTALKTDLDGLNEQKKMLTARMSKATTPEQKAAIEKQLNVVTGQLKAVNEKIAACQNAFIKFGEGADKILFYRTQKELGLAPKPEAIERQATIQSASVTTQTKKENAPKPTLQTKSGGGSPVQSQPATGGATGSGASSFVQGGNEGVTEGPLLGTAGAEGAGGGIETSPLAQTMGSDFSGTTMAIASTSNSLRSDARKTDKVIKSLLRAALAGNFEAIKMALIFLDKRASQITIGMGAQTIKAMQNYEKQMSALSAQIGKLKGGEPDYNAQLAKMNSEMNQYSMNRQAISNFLRDTMSMREEIGNLTSSFLNKAGQLSSTLSRWG